ncbi:MAG: Sir2 family NAD-dependent protein deacetylase [Bacteroidota bacterium]
MKKIVVLTGAGISAESGLKTFRDSNGLWGIHRIEDVATPEAWRKSPEFVQAFYNVRRKEILEAQANLAHIYLKELEADFDIEIVTQNIDDLHERAGSSNVLHLHGNILFTKSSGPNQEIKYYPTKSWELKMSDLCDEGYPLRPHVVWFGEEVPMLEKAAEICSSADIFIVIGTSLNVYPAASLIHYTKKECIKIVIDPKVSELNLDKSFIQINKSAVEGVKDLRLYLNV